MSVVSPPVREPRSGQCVVSKCQSEPAPLLHILYMVAEHLRPAAVAAAPAPAVACCSCAHFMWTLSTSHPIGKAEGLVYIVSQPNVIITKITGYNEAD